MKVRTERQDGILIVGASGRIDARNAREFARALENNLESPGRGVILDCDLINYISSAGLRVILQTTKHLDRRRVPFLICGLSPAVRELFRISGFDQIIPVFASRTEAIESLPR